MLKSTRISRGAVLGKLGADRLHDHPRIGESAGLQLGMELLFAHKDFKGATLRGN